MREVQRLGSRVGGREWRGSENVSMDTWTPGANLGSWKSAFSKYSQGSLHPGKKQAIGGLGSWAGDGRRTDGAG